MSTNAASVWRLMVAQNLAAHYRALPNVRAVLVSSSVARGHSDRFSDLDIIVFWQEAPLEDERRAVIVSSGADLAGLYPYDETWKCWADMYNIGRNEAGERHTGLATDVTHYLVSQADAFIRAVTKEYATDEQSHNLVRLIADGAALHGETVISRWQASISYPEELATAMVMKYGQIDYFWRWRSCLERGNNIMLLNENFSRYAQRLLRTLLALNRVYFFGFGWLEDLLARIIIAPSDFSDRFRAMWQFDAPLLAGELMRLIQETYDLIAVHLPGADVERLRRIFHYERTFWEEAPPGLPGDGFDE